MPESSALPEVLRRRLSPFEQNVLQLAARGGTRLLVTELGHRDSGGVKTEAHAEQVLAAAKAKAARILQEGIGSNGNGRAGGEAKCARHGEYVDRGHGCPVCHPEQGGGARPKPAAEKPTTSGAELPSLAPTTARRPKRKAREEKRASTPAPRARREKPPAPPAREKQSLADFQRQQREGQLGREGWPHTEGTVRRQTPPPGEDEMDPRELARMKREREGWRPQDSILPPEREDGADAEEASATDQDAAGDVPPASPVAPAVSSSGDGAAPAPASDDAPRQRGRRGMAYDELIEALRGMMLALGREPTWNDFSRGKRPEGVPSAESFRKGMPTTQLADWIAAARDGWPESDGIPTRVRDGAGRPMESRPCVVCGDEFETSVPNAECCPKDDCKREMHRRKSERRHKRERAALQAVRGDDVPTEAAANLDRDADAQSELGSSADEEAALHPPAVPPCPVGGPAAAPSPRPPAGLVPDEPVLALAEAERWAQLADGALPETLLKGRYLAALLRRIEQGDTAPDLLDRFERLAGIAG